MANDNTRTPLAETQPVLLQADVIDKNAVQSRDRSILFRLRWVAIIVFIVSNALNFLDRQLLSSLAPAVKSFFHVSNGQYGTLISSFSVVYAVTCPFAGLVVDYVGLNWATLFFVGIWSSAGIGTAFVRGFGGLLWCRALLGLGEGAALPLLSKANASYLPSSEWGIASAVGSLALTVGSVAAPLMASMSSGWRSPFLVTGVLGWIWIALWLLTSRIVGTPQPSRGTSSENHLSIASHWDIVRTPAIWLVILAYPLVLTGFVLWMNWTTVYLVQFHHLSPKDANRYFAWLPPVFVALGGFVNGWLSYRWIRGGMDAIRCRIRICRLCLPLFVAAAATPFLPTPTLAIAGICLTLFACQTVVGSLNILPVDLFGPRYAAFSISLLACSYSLIQTFVSPLIGICIDRFGFSGICVAASILPVLGVWLLRRLAHER